MSNIYKEFGIYRITNKINGKTYVGKTSKSFGDRWDCHKTQLNGGYHDNKHLQRAWFKYGANSFEFCIIESVNDASLLNDMEIKYINHYRNIGLCYNIKDGGDGGFLLGSHLSEDAKQRIGEKNRINMTGKKVSDETRKKMSESQKKRYESWTKEDRILHGEISSKTASGYKWKEESKKKFSDTQKTKPNGAKYSIEQVKEIRRLHEEEGMSFNDISAIMNIPRHTVYLIATYRRWTYA